MEVFFFTRILTSHFNCISFIWKFFSRVLFNNLKRKILPMLFKGFYDSETNQQEHVSYLTFQEKVTEKILKLSADLVLICICYINDIVDADVFHYIFSTYKKILTIILLI